MAGAGRYSFTAGAVLTASQVQTYLQDQSVMYYASAAARTSGIGTAVSAGMVSYRADGTVIEFYNGTAWVGLDTTAGVATLTGKTLTSPQETMTISATAASGTVNFDVATQGDLFYTTNASANFTLNIRGNSTTTLNNWFSQTSNVSVTVTFRCTNGATPFYANVFQIDGSAVTPKWVGQSAPTAGNASAIDLYTLNIVKTGNAAFTVFASQSKAA